MERWKPNTTVATVVPQKNPKSGDIEYLFVHEVRNNKPVYNQPAGHLDEGESLVAAAVRETQEETGWTVEITGLVGIYRFIGADNTTYMRYVFAAKPLHHNAEQSLDDGIIAAVWLSYNDLLDELGDMRSSIVKQAVDDYLENRIYPLSLLHEPS